MYDQEQKNKFIELRAKGKSFDAISEALGISKPTLIEWSKNLKHEINNLTQVHLDELRRKHELDAENRISSLGIFMHKVREELSSRDLSEVPTEKLFGILTTLNKQASEIGSSMKFTDEEDLGARIFQGEEVAWEVS